MVEKQRRHLKELHEINTRRLRELERQAALYGPSAAPDIRIQIEDLQVEIQRIEAELKQLNAVQGLASSNKISASSSASIPNPQPHPLTNLTWWTSVAGIAALFVALAQWLWPNSPPPSEPTPTQSLQFEATSTAVPIIVAPTASSANLETTVILSDTPTTLLSDVVASPVVLPTLGATPIPISTEYIPPLTAVTLLSTQGITGNWQGQFIATASGGTDEYADYQLEIKQTGDVISGTATAKDPSDSDCSYGYVIRGITTNTTKTVVQFAEVGFNPPLSCRFWSAIIVYKEFTLTYSVVDGVEYLAGEWQMRSTDYAAGAQTSGTIKFSRMQKTL